MLIKDPILNRAGKTVLHWTAPVLKGLKMLSGFRNTNNSYDCFNKSNKSAFSTMLKYSDVTHLNRFLLES